VFFFRATKSRRTVSHEFFWNCRRVDRIFSRTHPAKRFRFLKKFGSHALPAQFFGSIFGARVARIFEPGTRLVWLSPKNPFS